MPFGISKRRFSTSVRQSNIRQRLRGGHKELCWAFIDRLDPDKVKIATVRLGYQAWLQALELEARMLQARRPRYNSRIRQPE